MILLGNDPASVEWRKQTLDANKQAIATQIGAQLASICAIVTTTAVDVDRMDYTALSTNIATLSSNISQMTSNAKMTAALLDDTESVTFLSVCRALTNATTSLLVALQPVVLGQSVQMPEVRTQMLRHAQEVAKEGYMVIQRLGEAEVSPQQQQSLIQQARNVSQAISALINQGVRQLAAESGAIQMYDMQELANFYANQMSVASETLVTTAMVAAPAINMAVCQDQLIQNTLFIKDAMNGISEVSQQVRVNLGPNANVFNELVRCCNGVDEAIAKLVDYAKKCKDSGVGEEVTDFDRHYDAVMMGTLQMLKDTTTSAAIVNGAKALTVAATQLVNYMKQRSDAAQASFLTPADAYFCKY